MSRSYRHNPIMGIADSSDKWSKRNANRKHRKAVRMAIDKATEKVELYDDGMKTHEYYPDVVMPDLRDVSDPWSFAKDGKQRITDPKWMRK